MRPKRLLLTGAAGEISRVLRPALHGVAERLRWHDLRAIDDAAPGEEVMTGDLTVPGVAETAIEGVDCVIHLAGIPRETGGTPDEILAANVVGTHRMFEAACHAGVRRFIFASSNHVIGFYRTDRPLSTVEPPRPDGH
jgi:uronate dehydrogenase